MGKPQDLKVRPMPRKKYRNRIGLIPDIGEPLSYVDSIAVRMPRLLDRSEFKELKLALEQNLRKVNGSVVLEKLFGPDPAYGFDLVLWVHQPTIGAIKLLQKTARCELYAVHVALDVPVGPDGDLAGLRAYLGRHLQKNSRPVNPVHRYKDTMYVGGLRALRNGLTGVARMAHSRRGTELVIYSDRPSKVTGEICCHMEWRTTGARSLGQQGLSTLAEVLRINHTAFWRDHLRLQAPPSLSRLTGFYADRLGRRQKTVGDGQVFARTKRLELARNRLEKEMSRLGFKPNISQSSDVLFACRQIKLLKERPNRLFDPVDHAWLLPKDSVNALWTYEGKQPKIRIKMLEEPYLMQDVTRGSRSKKQRLPFL